MLNVNVGAAALLVAGGLVGGVGAAEETTAAKEFRQVARPFIDQHCMECHSASKAKAGFRVDLLGTDFTAAKVAEQWKEVLDRINAGEMPPKSSARPDPKAAAAFVAWVNGRLQQVESAAK